MNQLAEDHQIAIRREIIELRLLGVQVDLDRAQDLLISPEWGEILYYLPVRDAADLVINVTQITSKRSS